MRTIKRTVSRHYSPLRYPGGKSFLSTFLSGIIKQNNIEGCTYVEPYAGGCGAGLTLLFLEQVDSIVINDLDKAIYSFWKSILLHSSDFIDMIRGVEVNINEWERQKEIYTNKQSSILELGFATFYLNRTNRSGIIEGGVIGGKSQLGKWLINARFNKEELISRIKNIASYKSRIKVTNKDGIDLLKSLYKEPNFFTYLDPPYYIKGSCLYLNHYLQNNHVKLADFLNSHNDFFWLLTYDNVPAIKTLYQQRRCQEFALSYHIDIPKNGKELLILSDRISMI